MNRFGTAANKAWIGAVVPAALVLLKYGMALHAGTETPSDAEIGAAVSTIIEGLLVAVAAGGVGFGAVYSIPNRPPKEGADP